MKSGFISIVGRTNVGKSTLLNALIGEKVAIVSDKPQTTRGKVVGIYNDTDVQLVFIDTPGIHTPKSKLGKHMMTASSSALADADIILLVTECKPPKPAELNLIERFKALSVPVILVLNKTDIVPKENILKIIESYASLYEFLSIIPVSALQKDATNTVLKEIMKNIEDGGQALYPTDIATSMTERELVEEVLREKFLQNLHEEIPHGIVIETLIYSDTETVNGQPISKVTLNIICEKEQHKGIIIGKQGAMLKKAASDARLELEEMFGHKIFLECFVKVKEGWRDSEPFLRDVGLSVKE